MTKSIDVQKVAVPGRVYGLDALRSIMMLLGLVIHTALTYGSMDYGIAWSLKDPNNSFAFDVVVLLIHAFRMPVFFVAAGYFAALLFYKKGPKVMMMNRVKRILFPFVLGVLIVYPLVVFAFVYTWAAFDGATPPLDTALSVMVSGGFLPLNVAHLWFLCFLMMFAIIGWGLGMAFKKNTVFTKSINKAFAYIFRNFWTRTLCMSLLLFICLYWMGSPYIKNNVTWNIDPATFVTYLVFFGAGWVLYRTDNLESLKSYPLWQLGVAIVLFFVSLFSPWPAEAWVLTAQTALSAIYSSLFIFGFTALFLTYFNFYSPRLGYIMDSAYWVYIIQLPIVAFIPGLLVEFAWPSALKFAITLSVSSIICFVTYKYFVRGRFIGMLLNGKVHKKRKLVVVSDMVLKS